MTEEQEKQLETLRAAVGTPEWFSYDVFDRLHDGGFVATIEVVPPATPLHGGHYKANPSEAGELILALAKERDFYKEKSK